jgi:hypothetical protein
VHSLDHDPFCESGYPDLLHQDLSIVPLACGRHDSLERASGIELDSIHDYVSLIEWCFERYARRAVAAKCAWAYLRPLQVRRVQAPPTAAFELLRAGKATTEQAREVEDFPSIPPASAATASACSATARSSSAVSLSSIISISFDSAVRFWSKLIGKHR